MDTSSENSHALSVHKNVLSDILQGVKLEQYLLDVEHAIEEIDKKIAQDGAVQSAYDKLKNELYYLKYEILERI